MLKKITLFLLLMSPFVLAGCYTKQVVVHRHCGYYPHRNVPHLMKGPPPVHFQGR